MNPAGIKANGTATITPQGIKLTSGGSTDIGSAFLTTPLNVTKPWRAQFSFQMVSVGGAPLGAGMALMVQGDRGYGYLSAHGKDDLGIDSSQHAAIKFDAFCDNVNNYQFDGVAKLINSTGLYINNYPTLTDPDEIQTPFTFSDRISVIISYDPVAKTVTQTMAGGQVWSHTYTGVDLRSLFTRVDNDGTRAFIGVVGSCGSFEATAQPVGIINVYEFSVDQLAPNPSYRSTFTLPSDMTTCGDAFDASGVHVRTLWQCNRMAAGAYTVAWDGKSELGMPMSPVPTIRVVGNVRTTACTQIGNGGGYPSVGISGVVASLGDDDSLYYALQAADTVGGGCVRRASATTGAIDRQFNSVSAVPADVGTAIALDQDYVFLAAQITSTGSQYGIVKCYRPSYQPQLNFTGGNQFDVAGKKFINLGGRVDSLAVTNYDDPDSGVLYALSGGVIYVLNKVTGAIQSTISAPGATAIACTASRLYVASGKVVSSVVNGVTTTSVTLPSNVRSMSVLDQYYLYVADDGGKVRFLDPATLQQAGLINPTRAAVKFKSLKGVAVDANGSIYVVQELRVNKTSLQSNGVQASRWTFNGVCDWSVGGYEYQGGATATYGSSGISSSMRQYKLNGAGRSWAYCGTIDYNGPQSDVSGCPPKLFKDGTFVKSIQRTGPLLFIKNGTVTRTVDTVAGQTPDYMFCDQSGAVWGHIGNVIYCDDRMVCSLPFRPNSFTVNDGIYCLVYDTVLGVPSSLSVYGNYSIGGSNLLYKFSTTGSFVWMIRLPSYAVAVDYVPGTGVIVGMLVGSEIYQVTTGGQLVTCSRPPADDWLDQLNGSISAARNYSNNCIDVITEAIGTAGAWWHSIFDSSPTVTLYTKSQEATAPRGFAPVYIVSNLSKQPLTIPYDAVDQASSVSQIPFNQGGMFLLRPKKNLLIESARVDYEQLVNLERSGTIKLLRSRRRLV